MTMGRGMRRLRIVLRRVLHTSDSPQRTAAAFALGVFLGFSPLLGIHTILALGLAFALRLNRLAVLSGTFVLNPLTIVPIYGAGTTLGFLILGRPAEEISPADVPVLDVFSFSTLTSGVSDHVRASLLPFLLGTTLLGAAAAAAAFPLSLFLVQRMRAIRIARRRRIQEA
jgi:uncharacterized protein